MFTTRISYKIIYQTSKPVALCVPISPVSVFPLRARLPGPEPRLLCQSALPGPSPLGGGLLALPRPPPRRGLPARCTDQRHVSHHRLPPREPRWRLPVCGTRGPRAGGRQPPGARGDSRYGWRGSATDTSASLKAERRKEREEAALSRGRPLIVEEEEEEGGGKVKGRRV